MPLLVLFDIDGTLLRPCGLGRRSLDRAFLELYDSTGTFDEVRFHGCTDPEIIGEGLRRVGAPAGDYDRALARYLEHLEVEVASGPPLTLPGVLDLLHALGGRDGITLGLVTGNVRRGAEIKLSRDDLFDRFAVGAFGGEADDRSGLIRLARERAHEAGHGPFEATGTVYVGDTERDVEAARDGGAIAVAVATGTMDEAALSRTGPDHVLASLDPERFLEEVLVCRR